MTLYLFFIKKLTAHCTALNTGRVTWWWMYGDSPCSPWGSDCHWPASDWTGTTWQRTIGPNILNCTALHCTALHCCALHRTGLHCTALHCTKLPYTSLHWTSLHLYWSSPDSCSWVGVYDTGQWSLQAMVLNFLKLNHSGILSMIGN